jgi:chromosome segregation ATPase
MATSDARVLSAEEVAEAREAWHANAESLPSVVARLARSHEALRAQRDELVMRRSQAEFASAAAFADLRTCAAAAGMTDDEYPRKAILRALADGRDLRAKLAAAEADIDGWAAEKRTLRRAFEGLEAENARLRDLAERSRDVLAVYSPGHSALVAELRAALAPAEPR